VVNFGMGKTKMTYFKEEDILHFILSDENETNSVELSPNITAELDENGDLIGIEILQASSFIRDTILESAKVGLLTQHPFSTNIDVARDNVCKYVKGKD
jgi:uncharacterized protein YuzE